MSEGIEAVGGVGSSATKPLDTYTQSIEAQQKEPALSGGRFDELTRGAVGKVFSNKIGEESQNTTRDAFTAGENGLIGDEKRAFQSDIARPGVKTDDEEKAESDPVQPMIDRMNSLYSDITIFNVAWGVATRCQRDISQLMRGS